MMKEEPPSLKFVSAWRMQYIGLIVYFKANETMMWGIREKLWIFHLIEGLYF